MSRSTRLVRRAILVAVLGAAAALGACADATTAVPPVPRAAASQRTNDSTPPDSTCFSGWTVIDGRWVCGPT